MSEEIRKGGGRVSFPLSMADVGKVYHRKWLEIKFRNAVKGEYLVVMLVCVRIKELTEI